MKTFVYDDACAPCTRAARVLIRRSAVGPDFEVVPYSRIRDRLSPGQRRLFAHEALFLDDDPAPGRPQELWGHEAVGAALMQSPHRADRAAGQAIFSRWGSGPARWTYAKVSQDRAILTKVLDALGVEEIPA